MSMQQNTGRKQKMSAGRHGDSFFQEERDSFGFRMMNNMGWSQGKGLGKNETGSTSFIRAKTKSNTLGIGAIKTKDDVYSVQQDMYNEQLKRLCEAVKQESNLATSREELAAEETKETSTTAALQNFMAKRSLYGKFKKAKDTSSYSAEAMAAIFGRKADTPPPVETKEQPVQAVDMSSLHQTTSSVSIRDYFAKKLADSSKKVTRFQAAAGTGFSMDQQSDYYDQMMSISHKGRGGLGLGARNDPPPPQNTRMSFTSSSSTPSSTGLGFQSESRPMGLGFTPASTDSENKASPEPSSAPSSDEMTEKQRRKLDKKERKRKRDAETETSTEASTEASLTTETSTESSTPEDDKAASKAAKREAKRLKREQEAAAAADTTSTPIETEPPQEIDTSSKKDKKKKKKQRDIESNASESSDPSPSSSPSPSSEPLSADDTQSSEKKKKKKVKKRQSEAEAVVETPVQPEAEPEQPKKKKSKNKDKPQ